MDEAFVKINEVEAFLMKLRHAHDREAYSGIPYDSMAYGEALVHWKRQGHPSNAYFSTDDPSVLEFAAELRKEFGMEIVTREEGLARERSARTKRRVVTGFEWSEREEAVSRREKLWN